MNEKSPKTKTIEANSPKLSLISFVALKQVTMKNRKIPMFRNPPE
jgi:hypothetical protein